MHYSKRVDQELRDSRAKEDISAYIKARLWRASSGPFDKYRLRFISAILNGGVTGRTIEVGCDIGLAVASYGSSSSEIVLFDRDVFSLKGARIINKNIRSKIEFVSGDITDLPFKDGLFDTVICFEVLEHVPKDRHEKVLGEIMRISKSDASIYFSTPNRLSVPGAEGRMIEILVKGYNWNGWDPDHKYIYSTGEFQELIKRYSNRVEKVCGFYFLPGSLTVRMPLWMQDFFGFLSFIFSKYLGSIPPFRSLGFTTIVKFRKD